MKNYFQNMVFRFFGWFSMCWKSLPRALEEVYCFGWQRAYQAVQKSFGFQLVLDASVSFLLVCIVSLIFDSSKLSKESFFTPRPQKNLDWKKLSKCWFRHYKHTFLALDNKHSFPYFYALPCTFVHFCTVLSLFEC